MAREGQTSAAHAQAERPAAASSSEPTSEPTSGESPEQTPAEVELEGLGDSPAFALAEAYIANAQALGLAAHNAVASQQQTAIEAMAATTAGVLKIFAAAPPAAAEAPVPPSPDPTPSQKEP